MDEAAAEATEQPTAAPPEHARRTDKPWMVAQWTPEEALEKARKGGLASKGKPKKYDLDKALNRELLRIDPGLDVKNGLRCARALVRLGSEGDVSALKLIYERQMGPKETKRTVLHGMAGDILERLRISGQAGAKGRVVDTSPVVPDGANPPQLPIGSATDAQTESHSVTTEHVQNESTSPWRHMP